MSNGSAARASRFQTLGGSGSRSAADHALALLVDGIRAGMFEVGDSLPPLRMLAMELGVSHVIARQAIEVLENAGVLEVRPGRTGGIFLVALSGIPQALAKIYRVPDGQETLSLLHARWLIESELAGMLCRTATQDALRPLEAIVDRLEATTDVAEFIELTVRFNMAMALAVGNPVLTGFLREILNRMAIVGLKPGKAAPHFSAVAPGSKIYRGLLESLLTGDSSSIRGHVADHMALIARIYRLGEVSPPALLSVRTEGGQRDR